MPHTVPGGGWSQLELTDALLDSICNVLVRKNFLTLKWYTDLNFFGDGGGKVVHQLLFGAALHEFEKSSAQKN
jgi:hypothetical protein